MLELDQSVLKWVSLSIATLLALMGAVAVCNEAHAFPFRRELLAFRRLPWYAKLVLIIFVCKFFAYGSVKTNQTDSVGGGATNDPPPLLTLSLPPRPAPRPTVTVSDIERGYQRMSEGWADHPTYTLMPTNAEHVGKWHLHGAYEDVVRVDFGDWLFPYGAQAFDHMWAFVWGKVRPNIHDAEREMAPVGAPMSAIPSVSRLWTASTPCDSRLITWERFTLGRVPIESSVTNFVDAQVELFPNGDYIIRSNEVEKVYRRIDPEDWDGDGWHNDDDLHPCDFDEAWSDLYQDLPSGANPDAYCWVDVRCDYNSYVSFVGDGYSDLCDPSFTALAGEVYRVSLLIGKTYFVDSTRPLTVVGRSDPSVEVTDDGTCWPIICWPVEFTIGDGPAPGPRPRLGATWNDGGRAFHVLTNPSFLGGSIDWGYDYCCPVWGDGTNFAFQCDNTCTCEGCTVYGYYGYEGYRLPVGGVSCGCSYVEDEGPAEFVEFGFTKAAAIYEDPYTNTPGVVVYPSPSNTMLRCVVRGGTYGGRLTVTLNGAGESRIRRIGGNVLPNNVEIAPGTERTFETEYTPIAPSATTNDIIATATFVENFLNETHTESATVTSIRLQLTALYDAPENHNPSRHVYGVGEEVIFDVLPLSSGIFLETERYDVADDSGYGYELFGMRERVAVPYASEYRCPVSASNPPPVRVCYEGSEYWPKIKIVEPEEIVTTGASWGENAVDLYYDGDRKCWPYGTVGSAALVTTNYVGPMYVSFRGVAFSEVPCYEEDVVTGCFATNHIRTHTPQAGAGKLHMIYEKNFFFVDGARSGAPELNWQPGSTMNWKIPIGWHRIASGYCDGCPLYDPDYERCKDDKSRKLLVGGRNDKYMQTRHIDANGTYRTEKFGHWISRSRWCRVILDGRTLQERHVEQ